MADPAAATRRTLRERPHLRETLETLLEVEDERPWTFDDCDCDAGDFGYLVSRPFVEEAGSGFRFADRATVGEVVRSVDPTSVGDDATDRSRRNWLNVPGMQRSTLDGRFLGLLGVALAFLGLMRSLTYRRVFRGDHVVSPGNDPYHYRYWVEQLLATEPGLFAPGDIADVLGGRIVGEPLTYVLGWWASVLLEGTTTTTGTAVAWLPVLAALGVGVLVAWMALVVTEDQRVAVLAVLTVAVIPAHGLYSAIGFFDHHPLDYLWVSGMAASLCWLAREQCRQPNGRFLLHRPGTWLVTLGFGLTVAAAMLAWNGAPLLLLGVAMYVTLHGASVVRTDDTATLTLLPVASGLAIATGIGHGLHAGFGWQEPVAVYAPAVVLAGTVGVMALADGIARLRPEPRWVLASAAGIGLVLFLAIRILAPTLYARYRQRFLESLLGREAIAEVRPLISTDLGLLGPVDHHGWWLFFAIPAIVVVYRRTRDTHDPPWLVVTGFAAPFLALSLVQIRFVGELSPFAAILAATGLVWAFARLDLCRPVGLGRDGDEVIPVRPIGGIRSSRQGVYLLAGLVIILSIGAIYTGAVMNTATISDEEYAAAVWMSEETTDTDEAYVLSRWGRNRMYNYLVSGEADTYGYALETYEPFLESDDPDGWYQRFDGHVDYVVIEDLGIDPAVVDLNTTYGQLRVANGSATNHSGGVGRFRLVHLTATGEQAIFRPVPGARLEGEVAPAARVSVETTVSVADTSFSYTRRTTADDAGRFTVRLAYPGTYRIEADGEDRGRVAVSAEAVAAGERVGTV